MRTIVLLSDGYISQNTLKVSNWLKFHGIKPTYTDDSDYVQDSDTLFLSDLFLPTPHLVLAITRGISCHSNSLTKEGKDGVLRTNITRYINRKSDETVSMPKIHTEHDDESSLIARINKRMTHEVTSRGKYEILYDVHLDYWYDSSVDNELNSRFYFHLLLRSFQDVMFEEGNVIWNINIYKWLVNQSSLSWKIEQEKTIKGDIQDAVKEFKKRKVVLGEDIKGTTFEVNVSRYELLHHPLTLPGIVRLKSIYVTPPIDLTTTVVTFYYKINNLTKNKDVYYDSLRKWATVRHPIIFYGNKESCDLLRSIRNDEFTSIVEMNIEEWPIVKDYINDWNTIEDHIPLVTQRQYSLVTNLKMYALQKASIDNPFKSEKIAWLDSGLFKSKHIVHSFPLEDQLFKDCKVVEGKMTVNGTTDIFKVTHEEMLANQEYIFSYVMIAMAKDWDNIVNEMDKFIRPLMSQGIFKTEQIYHTRLSTIKPEIFNIIHGSWKCY